ncbi:MAG: hypothetical protein PUB76_00890 [Oscillospiraceae bacterium]|nr:hypothetical protein [Oscillospiraceae bacterium]
MKRIKKGCLILAGCLCICMSCNPNVHDVKAESAENTGENASSTDTDNQLLTFDSPYTVIDDENVKMQIISIQKETFNKGEGVLEYITYSVNLYIENKNAEYNLDCSVSSTASYIDGYTVCFGNGDTKTKPGKKNDIAQYSCTIYPENEQVSSNGWEHITSLEDLLTFEATVDVTLYEDNGTTYLTVERYPVEISLKDYNQIGDDNQTAASLELIDGIEFGDTRDQVNEKIKSTENWPKMTTMFTASNDYFMQGYSCESPDLKWAFKLNIEGYRASITSVYKGDDGGLVDFYASVAASDDSVSKSDVFNGLQTKIINKYGDPVANADIENRKEKVGFAYDAFVNLQAQTNRSVDVEKYSEWDLPEYNAKIEMFLSKVDDREYVFIDYRYQE